MQCLYRAIPEMPLVSISNAQRAPIADANFAKTVGFERWFGGFGADDGAIPIAPTSTIHDGKRARTAMWMCRGPICREPLRPHRLQTGRLAWLPGDGRYVAPVRCGSRVLSSRRAPRRMNQRVAARSPGAPTSPTREPNGFPSCGEQLGGPIRAACSLRAQSAGALHRLGACRRICNS